MKCIPIICPTNTPDFIKQSLQLQLLELLDSGEQISGLYKKVRWSFEKDNVLQSDLQGNLPYLPFHSFSLQNHCKQALQLESPVRRPYIWPQN